MYKVKKTMKFERCETVLAEIVDILQKEGPQEPENLCQRLKIKKTDIERDIAALRHMEKIRGEPTGGKKLIRRWGQVGD